MTDVVKNSGTTVASGGQIKQAMIKVPETMEVEVPETMAVYGGEMEQANIRIGDSMEVFGEEIQQATLPNNIKIPKTMEAFGKEIKQATLDGKLIVIFFGAKWSGKCKYMFNQIASKLAADHKDVVYIVTEIDDMLELQWEWKIDCFPTFVLVKEEWCVEKISGPFPDELRDVIEIMKKRKVYERRAWNHPTKFEEWPDLHLKRKEEEWPESPSEEEEWPESPSEEEEWPESPSEKE